MSIQTIINNATGIAIGKKPVVAQTFSRGQQIRTSQRGPRVWSFVVTIHNGLKYSANRGVLEEIARVDRLVESEISLSERPGMSYITQYLGGLSESQRNQIQITDWDIGSDTLTISNLPSVASDTVMFQAGDLIQPEDSRYPYTVVGQVLRGSSNSISVVVHRGRVNETGYDVVGKNLLYAGDVTWRVIATQVPDWTIEAGDLVSWTGDFTLVESIL
jgi:hypothetical protein